MTQQAAKKINSKSLIIAEKPSVARDISQAITNAAKRKQDGYIETDKYYISWAVGHLVSLAEPEDYAKHFKKWDITTLPIIPQTFKLKTISKTAKQFQIIKQLMDRSDVTEVICATDAGREGELIFRYIYQLANCNKPIKRLWISSMTEEAISKGFAELKPGSSYDNLFQSARCRSQADWLVGINGTRAYTTSNNTLYSIGRVQTPTLAMLVERELAIRDFTPQDYYEIVVDCAAAAKRLKATWIDRAENDSKIIKLETAQEIAAEVTGSTQAAPTNTSIKASNTTAEISEIKKEKKKIAPPLLYDLTELQRDANRFYGYTAKQTLDLAQALYEKHKLLTYPRTDSRYLTNDMKKTLAETITKLQGTPWAHLLAPIASAMKFTTRIINDKKVSDHHAIIPTPKVSGYDKLTKQEANIYDLVVKRLLAVFYPHHVFEMTTVYLQAASHDFIAKGKVIKELGWKAVYSKVENGEQGSDNELPPLKKGEQLLVEQAEILTKQTQPPKPFNESTLLGAMENAGRQVEDEELREQLKDGGIGTPATRASIIERLIQVEYVERRKKAIVPTEKGIALIKAVPLELKSPETTGKWERALNKMARGEFSSERFMESIERFTHYIVKTAGRV